MKLDFYNIKTSVKKRAPEILLISGILEGIAGTVFACKGTLKAKEISREEAGTQKKKLAKAIDICKVYAPAAGLTIAGTVSVCASHGLMKKRYAGLVAAYGALSTSFVEYRSRVREEVGEKREEELYYGTDKETISIKITQKDGKEKKVSKKVDVRTKNGLSPYARKLNGDAMFLRDADDPYYVDSFIETAQGVLNDQLLACGHLYLNKAYYQLELDEDDVGQIVGWIYDPEKLKDGNRDNYIKIIKKEIFVKKENGTYEKEVWLDFNVDGVIFGKMSKKEYNTHIQEIGNRGLEFSNVEE